MSGLEITSLAKTFADGTRALQGIDLDVADGELLALVGPSGSGKTTLLRLVAGLDQPTGGSIRLGGKELAGMPPHRRNVALVFQNLALYGHLNVAENLGFGLNAKCGMRSAECGMESRKQRVEMVAEMLGIGHLMGRYPAELSGGEQQRVALGRAIVRQPAALLLDEPLSSVDGPTRRSLRRELKAVQRRLGVPTIYVTHDQAEALAMGDRIAVLRDGRIEQVGTPEDVYERPRSRFVGEFFGPQGMNVIEGELRAEGGRTTFAVDGLTIDLASCPTTTGNRKVICGFRPEEVETDSGGELSGEIESTEAVGDARYATVRTKSGLSPITVRLPTSQLKAETECSLRLKRDRLHWFDPVTGQRL